MHNSNRKYLVVGVEGGDSFVLDISINKLMKKDSDNDSEVLYAMQEITDEILDLKKNESMFFQADRNNEHTKGVILRIE